MEYSQLELFQTAGDYEKTIFERAKRIKKTVQENYNKLIVNLPIFKQSESGYGTLIVSVTIDQISDSSSIQEPSTPKMFIWQFTPRIILEIGGKKSVILEAGKSDFGIAPKIIPKWINELFTSHSFTHGDFLKFTTQYFSLETIIKIIENEKSIKIISEKLGNKKLIVFVDCKLFGETPKRSSSLLEKDIVNKIRNFYSKIQSLQKENWYFIGAYEGFYTENDLLKDLDSCDYIKEEKKLIFGSPKGESEITNTFQNDNLFLNNLEFFSNQKFNTDNWDCDCILPPKFVDFRQSKIAEQLQLDKSGGKPKNNGAFYAYLKGGAGERFFRVELLLSESAIHYKNLLLLLSISRYLKNDD